MNKAVLARVDRSMTNVKKRTYAEALGLYDDDEVELSPPLKDKVKTEYIPFQEALGIKSVDYDLLSLDTHLVDETINYRHPVALLAISHIKRYPNIFRLNPVRLLSMIRELQTYGEVKLINFFGSIEDAPDALSLRVEHPSDSKKDMFIFLSEMGDLPAEQYLNYKDDVINDKVVYYDLIQVHFDVGNLEAEKLCAHIDDACGVEISDNEVYIEMIIQTMQGLTTQRVRFELEYGNDLDLHYGDGFNQFHNKLIERIHSRDKGIVMFHGPPGNGKTHYIRRLLPDLNRGGKRVILIPKHILESLESPAFNLFMLQHFVGQKIVFVMEDAESVISKRSADGGGRSQLVSTLLNITDGILNDIFSIQVVLTFNTSLTSIDEALLRKGRLIAKYEFKSIGREQAARLAEHLGVTLDSQPDKEEFTLAEIYALKETEEDDLLINQNLESKKEPLGF